MIHRGFTGHACRPHEKSGLASQSYSQKPSGTAYSHFHPSANELATISSTIDDAVIGSAFSAALSYAEAISGLQKGSVSWSIIKLYYSCFYSLRAMLILNKIIPFNYNGEMLLDIPNIKFIKGGNSSHHWNWNSIRKIPQLSTHWFISSDSQESYEKLRKHRENVNYTHGFTDPNLHHCLTSSEPDLSKRIRIYRDDSNFLYTYLIDHLAIAYPTKLIFSLDTLMQLTTTRLTAENISHLQKVWPIKDRCPLGH